LHQHYGRNEERRHNIRREAHARPPKLLLELDDVEADVHFSGSTIRRDAKQQRQLWVKSGYTVA
jgi:hypothetical protein